MISKELLSEVLGHEFCAITELTQSVDSKYISWSTYEEPRPHDWKQINIHELAFMTRDYLKTISAHLTLNQDIDSIFKEADSIYERFKS